MLRKFVIAVSLGFGLWAQSLPNRPDSFHFAVIGDSGTGGRGQYDIGILLARYQETSPFKTRREISSGSSSFRTKRCSSEA